MTIRLKPCHIMASANVLIAGLYKRKTQFNPGAALQVISGFLKLADVNLNWRMQTVTYCTEGGQRHTFDESNTCFDCGAPKPTSTPRVLKLRDKAKRKGWTRRDYYATPDEHDQLKERLKELRG